ncbi:hypothetical protein [Frigidibacter mobilis]|uniref:Uncharacterized protein n=1 Tax=Frigidibacter mobilis TaxID=1335048 RepID=A0A159Z2B0_9RHOB|nr:hypothetical protein [Frigidibacter mobilis]AMY68204.1 hypothetical protein AKL17_0945 [Frigidibacter mobilis]
MEQILLTAASLVSVLALAGLIYPFRPFGKRRNALLAFVGCLLVVGALKPDAGADRTAGTVAVAEVKPELGVASAGATETEVKVASDPQARYFAYDLTRRDDGLVEVSTRRVGPSGTSFAIRLVQCDPLMFAYLAEADTKSDLRRSAVPAFSVLVDGSISDVISRYACEAADKISPPAERNVRPAAVQSDLEAEAVEQQQALRDAVEARLWERARAELRTLTSAGLATEAFKSEIEERLLALVRPLSASERDANLQGYELLAALRPENATYIRKVEQYQQAIEAARTQAVTRLRKSEDRIEGITWYQHPNQPKYLNSRSTAYLYIGRRGEAGPPFLRLNIQYTASEWLFVRHVIAWHDGIKEPLTSGPFERDNNSVIWEWVDVAPSAVQVEILRSLAGAKEAVLRFEGDKYRRDVTLSAGDKAALREVLEAFEVMHNGM